MFIFLGACTKRPQYMSIYDTLLIGGGDLMEFAIEDANVKSYKIKDSVGKDNPTIYIDRKGGSFKISVTNYGSWNISSVEIKKSEDRNFFVLWDCGWRLRRLMKSYPDWYDLTLKDTSLYVDVKANKTKLKRLFKINMSSGDMFGEIYVVQDK